MIRHIEWTTDFFFYTFIVEGTTCVRYKRAMWCYSHNRCLLLPHSVFQCFIFAELFHTSFNAVSVHKRTWGTMSMYHRYAPTTHADKIHNLHNRIVFTFSLFLLLFCVSFDQLSSIEIYWRKEKKKTSISVSIALCDYVFNAHYVILCTRNWLEIYYHRHEENDLNWIDRRAPFRFSLLWWYTRRQFSSILFFGPIVTIDRSFSYFVFVPTQSVCSEYNRFPFECCSTAAPVQWTFNHRADLIDWVFISVYMWKSGATWMHSKRWLSDIYHMHTSTSTYTRRDTF